MSMPDVQRMTSPYHGSYFRVLWTIIRQGVRGIQRVNLHLHMWDGNNGCAHTGEYECVPLHAHRLQADRSDATSAKPFFQTPSNNPLLVFLTQMHYSRVFDFLSTLIHCVWLTQTVMVLNEMSAVLFVCSSWQCEMSRHCFLWVPVFHLQWFYSLNLLFCMRSDLLFTTWNLFTPQRSICFCFILKNFSWYRGNRRKQLAI